MDAQVPIPKAYPYQFQDGQPDLFDFTLAGSGATIAQEIGVFQNSLWTYTRQVTPLSGAPVIWSDSPTTNMDPVLLSPDGTLIGVSSSKPDPSAATNILKNGALVTAVPGFGIGWIDNSRILANQYVSANGGTVYGEATIYDATGARIASPALPELKSIQTVTSDSVYDPSHNAIYSLTTGQPLWTGALPGSGLGAVAG